MELEFDEAQTNQTGIDVIHFINITGDFTRLIPKKNLASSFNSIEIC